jgi:mono/diheme cytochrome c family protein
MSKKFLFLVLIGLVLLALAACAGPAGPAGPQGPQGPAGPQGATGPEGSAGANLTEEQTAALETAGSLAAIQFPALDEVRRGCPACHALAETETGKYTLPYEAIERAEARGGEHPEAAPDGTSLAATEEVNVTVCLQCHAAGKDDRQGKGVIAPLSLRDIVHPAHMNSQYFTLHYGGNCLTCHNINGEGGWDLLTEKVDVNEKGVPNPEALPIPGAIPIGGVKSSSASTSVSVSRGGRLYDSWIKEAGVEEPASDQPLWASQTTNTRTGTDTWRCKECHGWDYKGAEGAYGSGSHFTGFPGVYDAGSKDLDELVAILSGESSADHDFSAMGDEALVELSTFLQKGLADFTPLIDGESKSAVGGDVAHGQELFTSCLACHGEDGRALNFGSDEEPEYVATIALDNPWEFLHKVRAGQPGSTMPAAMDGDWTLEDLLDLLAFAQSLPIEAP